MDNIQEYIDSGHEITKCPPCVTLERSAATKRVWHAPKNGHDKEICSDCGNKGRCEKPCSPLKWIDGNVPRKENFITERMLMYAQEDYKDALAELAENKRFPITLTDIQAIKDTRSRAICALLMVKVPKRRIAKLLNISRTHLYRIIMQMLHSKMPLSLKKSK